MRVIKRLGFYGAQPWFFLPSASDFLKPVTVIFRPMSCFVSHSTNTPYHDPCRAGGVAMFFAVHFLLLYAVMAAIVFPGAGSQDVSFRWSE